jgi:DNA end-binding protein Ku
MPRALWKGAISFGLVHIPVALYPAARENRIDFDWLDKRNMKPVGYKRVNKATGKEVAKENIVRGIEVEEGQYVVLDDEEIKAALPQTTQTVEIVGFIDAGRIDPAFFERPYVLAPAARGEKVYVLLREALKKSGRLGVARVVIQTKQHLAALMPKGDALVLNTLRWCDELRAFDELDLPGHGKKTAPSARELQMAEQLIADMSTEWSPEQYEDHFRDTIMKLVETKREHGEVREVETIEAPAEGAGAEVIDLTELLKRSLHGRQGRGEKRAAPAKKAPAKRAAAKRGSRADDAAPKRAAAAGTRRTSK